MNTKSLYNITYGVYLLSARDNERDNACIINTAMQIANNPTRISVAAIKGNLTHDMIASTGAFNICPISTDAPFSLFQHFGMQSGRTVDKFADFTDISRSENGIYYLTKWANAFLSLKVTESHDLGSHTLFIGELVDGDVLSSVPSCSYGYYQSTIKKSAPKPAAKKGWKCKICGYVYEGDTLPENYVCPICKHGPEDFEYFGEEPVRSESEMTWAAEHVVGIAQGVSEDILGDLRTNFEGECSEVGMYLAMARVAHREGYPEIGSYYEKAAWEEAEHAVKFAELLGEVVTASTKKNLEMRAAAENGATAGKFDLAKRAKELNLDAIHDTVHEMARDEARHGKAFQGFLERYFA